MQPCLDFPLHLHTTHALLQTNFFVLSVSLPGAASLASASISNLTTTTKKKDTPTISKLICDFPSQELKTTSCIFVPLLQYIRFGIARHGPRSERSPLSKELHIKNVRLPLIECRTPFWWIPWSTVTTKFSLVLLTTCAFSFLRPLSLLILLLWAWNNGLWAWKQQY